MVALGLDIGERRVGVAVSSSAILAMALPLETIQVSKKDDGSARVVQLIRERGVTHLVVGWPLTMEGRVGRATDRVDKFLKRVVSRLKGVHLEVKIVRWDERLTTTAAESFLIGADVSRARRKQVVDQVAATHILEGFLRAQASTSTPTSPSSQEPKS